MKRHCETNDHGLDFIGDIHGQFHMLEELLRVLGYAANGQDGYRHPDGRRAVFLGDYIDRGPGIRETLRTVRAMVDARDAHALIGNHEFNAVAFATHSPRGGYLRPHTEKNREQHEETVVQFKGHEREWKEWMAWFKRLPMWLDFGDVRAVHACWDEASMKILGKGDLRNDAFLELCATESTKEFIALESILKGPELPLPDGFTFTDKQGIERTSIRTRWWNLADGDELPTFGDIAMPPGSLGCDRQVPEDDLRTIPHYNEPVPVFAGHYWLPATSALAPLAPNVGCLDFSVGQDGPIVAYRWDGEAELTSDHMVAVEPSPQRASAILNLD